MSRSFDVEGYREQLAKIYSESFLEDMDSIFSGDITMTQIAKKYNRNKMTISNIFKKLYGMRFRDAKKKKISKDNAGRVFVFETTKNRQVVIGMPEELYQQVKSYSEGVGLSMSLVIRDCIIDFLRKDGLSKLNMFF